MRDPLKAVNEAESAISERQKVRDQTQLEFRSPLALEIVADELTRVRAELTTLRGLFASFSAMQRDR